MVDKSRTYEKFESEAEGNSERIEGVQGFLHDEGVER